MLHSQNYYFVFNPIQHLGRRRQWQPTPVLLPGKSHGRRSLVGCSPWGRWESDTTERLHFHFSLSCIGEGNGNPLQCSCLENSRDGGAWWAAVYGVAQSRTRLMRLSSSSSIWDGEYFFRFKWLPLLFKFTDIPIKYYCRTRKIRHFGKKKSRFVPDSWLSTKWDTMLNRSDLKENWGC